MNKNNNFNLPKASLFKPDIAHKNVRNKERNSTIALETKENVAKKDWNTRLPLRLIEQLDDAIHELKKTHKITRDIVADEAYTDWLDKYREGGLIK